MSHRSRCIANQVALLHVALHKNERGYVSSGTMRVAGVESIQDTSKPHSSCFILRQPPYAETLKKDLTVVIVRGNEPVTNRMSSSVGGGVDMDRSQLQGDFRIDPFLKVRDIFGLLRSLVRRFVSQILAQFLYDNSAVDEARIRDTTP